MDDNPIRWNPWNKVVQDHRDGIVIRDMTDALRMKLGLPTPWTPAMAEYEVKLPPVAQFLNSTSRKAGIYKNLKTGREYRAYDTAYDATNVTSGRMMVLYRDVLDPEKKYAREWNEFFIKFEEVP